MTARIVRLADQGDGVAELAGREVFIPWSAPGDLAEVEILRDRGRILALEERSRDRADPPCVHYGACGGCALQHLTPAFQSRWKRERVVNALRRAGFDAPPVAPLIATPPASRRRATFAVRKAEGATILGFNALRSSNVEAVETCLVLHPLLQDRLAALRRLAGLIPAAKFDLAVTLCVNGLDVNILGQPVEEPRGRELADLTAAAASSGCVRISINDAPVATLAAPIVEFDGLTVTPPPGGFLQASREGEAALAGLVSRAARGAARIADLFSGCGTLSLPLARRAAIVAIDADAASLAALDAGARAAQRSGGRLKPVRTEARNLFERPLTAAELKRFDAALFDPPRAGAKAQARELAKSGVPTIVGVSCNPATFARDARIIADGGYALVGVTPVDQFVYSSHIELVGVFRRG
jgi:23S rRNA (uracil1939-C5)-methyltransferase